MTPETPPTRGELKFFGPEMLADPYPVYQRLRASQPVYRAPALDAWIVTTYEAVNAALRNPQLSSDRFPRVRARLAAKGLEALAEDRFRSLLHMDPPDHTRLRGLVSKAFTPRTVEAMEGHIQKLVDDFLDAVQARGTMDFIGDFAYPLPVTVIAEMLGVPSEDRDRFKHWSDEVAIASGGDVASLPESVLLRVASARNELIEYFRAAAERRRREPGNDLLTALVRAEEEGGRLSENELHSTLVLLLIAGNETTTNLLGNGLLALLRHPDQLRRVWDNPALISPAIEEMLRYDSPVQLTTRIAKVDMEIHGVTIRKGEFLYLVLGAANRDPAQFPNPDTFDVSRADNKHVSFGAGAHFCIGAPLARLEAQVALRTLRQRCPNLRLGDDRPEHRNNFNLRGLKALNVIF